jgi:hypothetical protein
MRAYIKRLPSAPRGMFGMSRMSGIESGERSLPIGR